MRSEATLKPKSPVSKGNRRGQPRISEISYELIVPMKVENRRARAATLAAVPVGGSPTGGIA